MFLRLAAITVQLMSPGSRGGRVSDVSASPSSKSAAGRRYPVAIVWIPSFCYPLVKYNRLKRWINSRSAVDSFIFRGGPE
jgi:hypothetical protein